MPRSRNAESASARDRRNELVQIAYRHIAQRGFEGLRVRDVAQEAGINNATLHYYFPTKETLVQSVVQTLLQEFRADHAPRNADEAYTPLGALRYEFEDVRYRIRKTPEMFFVLAELAIRSRRDAVIARIMAEVDSQWHAYLLSLLERGVREGAFRSGLDLRATVALLIAQLKAIGYQVTTTSDTEPVDNLIAQLAAQTEYWLTGGVTTAPNPSATAGSEEA